MVRPKIVYVDSYDTIAHFLPNLNRIEISKFFKQFPELNNFILTHELKHAEIHEKNSYSLSNCILDIKERFQFYTSLSLFSQYMSFLRLRNPKSSKNKKFILKKSMFVLAYTFTALFTSFFFFLTPFSKIKSKFKTLIIAIIE